MKKMVSLLLVPGLLATTVTLSGCAAPRAVAGVTKGVVKGTAKGVKTTTKVVTKPIR